MKNIIKKPLSVALSCALVATGAGAAVFAVNNDKNNIVSSEENNVSLTEQGGAENQSVCKDETVYVFAGADGTVKKIIVSDWIKNTLGSGSLSDRSELSDVVNVSGDESYTISGDNMRVWDAAGNDICYTGSIEKALPVDISVSYELDGKSISSDELAGKSGRVSIRFAYRNNQYETVEIDGKEEKIYVPFAMLTGMLLDNDIFRNVEVSNGKILNDGDRTAVIGLAFPELGNDLGIDSEKLDIPDHIVISADVSEFEMTNTMTVAVNDVFGKIDADKLNSFDDLSGSIGEMSDAMMRLTDGSSALYDGLGTLLEKSGELINGIDKLANGAEALKKGAGSLSLGSSELSDGAKALADGLRQLDQNSSAITDGAKQVFQSLLSMANKELAAAGLQTPDLTIDNYAQVLDSVIASLDADNVASQAQAIAGQKVSEAVNAQKDKITEAVTAEVRKGVAEKVTSAIRENVEAQVLMSLGMNKESYDAAISAGMISAEQQSAILSAIEAQMASDTVKLMIAAKTDEQMNTAEVIGMISENTKQQIELLIKENMASPEVQKQITEALEKARSGAASISALKEQLDSYSVFYAGVGQYTSGVSTAKNGADALSQGADKVASGAGKLYSGAEALYDGILTLKNGTPALIDGISKLRDGAMTLSDGLAEFNEKGVKRLSDAVDGDINGLITRVKAVSDVAKDYNSFSGISDEMNGQVKFIYRTDAIKIK